ncbi:hypothetical protein ACWDRB_55215 [Nonomuraea sp. NPDC003707]
MVSAFQRWLTEQGWTVEPATRDGPDIVAARTNQQLIGEVKGHTGYPGTDLDIAYGQLLRRMIDPNPEVRYALVVPASIRWHVERVPDRVRRALTIDLYVVDDHGQVTHIR